MLGSAATGEAGKNDGLLLRRHARIFALRSLAAGSAFARLVFGLGVTPSGQRPPLTKGALARP
jgi:hypothetical protein